MAIPVVVTLIATGCAIVLLPRVRESRLQERFREDGAIFASTVGHTATNPLDELIGFRGFVSRVKLDGEDESLEAQLQALPKFRHLAELQAFSIESAADLGEVYQLPRLRKASFSFCSGSFVSEVLAISPHLHEVEIFECLALDDDSLSPLASCRSLRRLEINGSSATGVFAVKLGALPQLKEIEIRHSPVSDAGLRAISRLSAVTRLRLMKGSDDANIELLNSMRSLEELYLEHFENPLEYVKVLARELPNTKVILNGSRISPARWGPGKVAGSEKGG